MKRWLGPLMAAPLAFGFFATTRVPGETAEEPPAVRVAGGTVSVPAEIRERLGLETSPIVSTTVEPEARAFGSVLDPAALILLVTEMQDAGAAAALSETQVRRVRSLFGADQTVSQRTLEQAENQLRIDATRRDIAQRRLQLEWGGIDATNWIPWMDRMAQHQSALLRVELPMGSVASPTAVARVQEVGRTAWIPATVLGAAPTVDPRSQGQAFLLRVEDGPATLRAGAAIEARLALTGPPHPAWPVSRSAVLRHLGRTWIYLQTAPDRFERREVTLDAMRDASWLLTTPLPEGTRYVSTAAAALLSAELQAAFGAAEGD